MKKGIFVALAAGALAACGGAFGGGAISLKGYEPPPVQLPAPAKGTRVAIAPGVFGPDYIEEVRARCGVQLEKQLARAGFVVVPASEPHALTATLFGIDNERIELRLAAGDGRDVVHAVYSSTTTFQFASVSGMQQDDWADRLAAYIVAHLVEQLPPSPELRAFAAAHPPQAPSDAASTAVASSLPSTNAGGADFVAAAPQPGAYALVVGIEHYRDVPAATGARGDAERFAALAGKTLGLKDAHVRVALDDHATRSDVLAGLRWLSDNVTSGGRAYFYFSGHGAPSVDSSTYLLPYDGHADDVAGTALAMSDVLQALGETHAKDVLAIVDACFSGAGGRSVLPPGARPLMRVRDVAPAARVALYSASQGDEISGNAPGDAGGVFTKYVTQALGRAEADVDGDGQISLRELDAWVGPRVARDAKQANRAQHPRLAIGDAAGAADAFIVEYGLPTK